MRMMVADLINGTTIFGTSDILTGTNSGTGTFMYVAIEPFYGISTTEKKTYIFDPDATDITSIYYDILELKYPQNIKCIDAKYKFSFGTYLDAASGVKIAYNFNNSTGIVSYTGTSTDTMKIRAVYPFNNDGTITEQVGTFSTSMIRLLRYYYEYTHPTINYSNEIRNACYLLPEQSGYNAYFTEDKIKHKLDNGKTLTYFKGFNFNADINFEQISGTDLTNLKEIKNLKTNLRFFPNIAEKPNLSYDVIWDNDFNYPFTVPTYTGGGYNGNIHFEGITRLGSIGDTI